MQVKLLKQKAILKCTLTLLSLVLFAVSSLISLIFLNKPVAQAATSSTINFQARILTNTGAVVPDGTYNVQFNLYYASGGGSIWAETYLNSGAQGLTTKNGYLTTTLGSLSAFSGINWDQALTLGITIRGTGSCAWAACSPTDSEMSPRMPVTAVPYAFAAGKLQTTGATYTSTLAVTSPTGGNQTFTTPDLGAGGSATLITTGNLSSITAVGTVATGTWNGTAIDVTHGGTGLTGAATGDILYASASNTISVLNKPASSTSFLQMTSTGVPSWTSLTADTFTQYALLAGRSGGQTLIGGTAANNTLILQGTSASGNTATNANLIFKVGDSGGTTAMTILNNSNVGIGDTSPDQSLEVMSTSATATQITVSNTSTGDSQIGFELVDGTNKFTLGVDNSDDDEFKLSTTALGTGDVLSVDPTTGTVNFGGDASYYNGSGDSERRLRVEYTYNSVSADKYGLESEMTFSPTGYSAHNGVSLNVTSVLDSSYSQSNVYGVRTVIANSNNGDIETGVAYSSAMNLWYGTGDIDIAYGFLADSPYSFDNGSGGDNIGTNYGFYVANQGASYVTNAYGLYLASQTGANTLNYSIYSAGGQNYLAGNLGIGSDATPDYALEVNSSGGANTQLAIYNTNAGDYDAQIGFGVADNTNSWTIGVDDSDSDKFKISTSGLGASTTSDKITVDSSNVVFGSSGQAVSLLPAVTNTAGYTIGSSSYRWKSGYFVDGITTGASSTTYAESGISSTYAGSLGISAASDRALTLTSNASATWSTSSGALTFSSATGVIVKNSADLASAFKVQNNAGTYDMLTVDTTTSGYGLVSVGTLNGTMKVSINGGGLAFNRNIADGSIYDSEGSGFQLQNNKGAAQADDSLSITTFNRSGTYQATPLTILQGGNIGVKKTPSSTGAYLQVAASTASYASINVASGSTPSSPATGDLWFNGTTLNFYNGSTTQNLLTNYWTLSGSDIYKNNSGNVGIGYSTPQYLLSVEGRIGPGSNIRVSDTGAGGIDFTNNGFGYQYAAKIYTFKNAASSEYYGFTNDYGSSTSSQLSVVAYAGTGNIGFYTGTGTTARLTIADNGNIGIGSASTTAKLEVNLTNGSGWSGNTKAFRALSPDNGYYLDLNTFVIATGNVGWQFSPNASTGITLNTSGSLGVGTTSPIRTMHVHGEFSLSNSVGGAGANFINISDSTGNNGDTSTLYIRGLTSNGSSGTTTNVEIAGNVVVTGASSTLNLNGGSSRVEAYYVRGRNLAGSGNRAVYSDSNGTLTNTSSDARLKINVQTMGSSLNVTDALMQLRGVYYNWDLSNPTVANLGPQREIGMIAQEVQTVLPEVIGVNSTGYLSLDYPKLTAFLVEVAKAQQTQINVLKNSLQNGNLYVDGAVIQGDANIGALNVSGPTTLASLHVTGDAQFDGSVAVTGNLSVVNLTVNGHIITAGNNPVAVAGSAAGMGAITTVLGNDTTGTVTIITGTHVSQGKLIEITFTKAFNKNPKIILTPGNPDTTNLKFYRDSFADKFYIQLVQPPLEGTTYTFDYMAME